MPVLGTSVVHTGWVQGGYTGWGMGGWVYRGAIPGYYPAAKLRSIPSGAGPGSPSGGWSGWGMDRAHPGDGGGLPGPPCGPGRSPRSPPCPGTPDCRLTANSARIDLIPHKVSQNRRVSLKYVHKACHSPYLKNEVQKSPLEILRFPETSAFSHKELMGLF